MKSFKYAFVLFAMGWLGCATTRPAERFAGDELDDPRGIEEVIGEELLQGVVRPLLPCQPADDAIRKPGCQMHIAVGTGAGVSHGSGSWNHSLPMFDTALELGSWMTRHLNFHSRLAVGKGSGDSPEGQLGSPSLRLSLGAGMDWNVIALLPERFSVVEFGPSLGLGVGAWRWDERHWGIGLPVVVPGLFVRHRLTPRTSVGMELETELFSSWLPPTDAKPVVLLVGRLQIAWAL